MFSRGIVAAMEDEAQATELAIDEAGSDSLEADLVEVVDMSGDIESGTNDMEQTINDAGQLERHVEVLTDAEGEGGASPEVIEATEIAVEAICARLGIYTGTGIPALESFSTKTGRARSTRVAIESIGEKIKTIWEAVKMAFKRLVNFVKDFFERLMGGNAKMLARVNALRLKAKKVKGTPAEKIKASGITNLITPSSRVEAASLTKALQGAEYDYKDMLGGLATEAAFDAFESVVASGPVVSGMTAPEGFQWTQVAVIGKMSIAALEPKKAFKGKEAYQAMAKITVKTKVDDSKGDAECPGLTKEACVSLLDMLETSIKGLMGNKVVIAKITQSLDLAVSQIASAVSAASKEDEGMGKRSTVIRDAVTSTANANIKSISLIGGTASRVYQAYLTLVERSLAGYKEESSKDKKD